MFKTEPHPEDQQNLTLSFYNDVEGTDSYWANIYHSSKSCQEKVDLAYYSFSIQTGSTLGLDCCRYNASKQQPRFWYVVASLCDKGDSNFILDYHLRFQQANSSLYFREFSYESRGLLTIYIVFFIVFLSGALLKGKEAWELYRDQSLTFLSQTFAFSYFMLFFSLLCFLMHYSVYSSDGVGTPGFEALGQILDTTSALSFMLLLLIISKGWRDMTSDGDPSSRRLYYCVLLLIFVIYIGFFMWQQVGWDPASSSFIYVTVPGLFVVFIYVVVYFYFLYEILKRLREATVKGNRNQKAFYFRFGCYGSVWFIFTPLFVFLSIAMPHWLKLKLFTCSALTLNTVLFSIYGLTMWPTIQAIDSRPFSSLKTERTPLILEKSEDETS